MPDLSHLKISKIPAAFAEVAEKHNELVQLIASIEAATGIDIKMVSSPPKKLKVPGTASFISKQPRGRIRIGLRPRETGGGTLPEMTEIHFNYFGQLKFDVDYTNGVLLTDNSAAITRYAQLTPNARFKAYDSAGNYVRIGYDGIGASLNDGTNDALFTMTASAMTLFNNSTNDYVSLGFDGSVEVYNNSNNKSLFINVASITHDMSIKTINVCNNGNSGSMLIIASNSF